MKAMCPHFQIVFSVLKVKVQNLHLCSRLNNCTCLKLKINTWNNTPTPRVSGSRDVPWGIISSLFNPFLCFNSTGKQRSQFVYPQTCTCCFYSYWWVSKTFLLTHLPSEAFEGIKRGLPSFMSSEWRSTAQSLFNKCNSVWETIRHRSIRMTASIHEYLLGVQIHIVGYWAPWYYE